MGKSKKRLSAGRVQSVALRIVCDREEEIDAFIPEEYWSLEASLLPEGEKKPITAKLLDKGGEKFEISSEEQMNQVLAELKGKEFKVCDMKKGERTKKRRFRLQPVLCSRSFQSAEFPDLEDDADCTAAV